MILLYKVFEAEYCLNILISLYLAISLLLFIVGQCLRLHHLRRFAICNLCLCQSLSCVSQSSAIPNPYHFS